MTVPGSVIPIYALVKLWHESSQWTPPLPEESDPQKVRKSLYRLTKNKYIKIKKISERKFKFELTGKGRKLLGKYNFADFKMKPRRAWDANWRMFVFDVPEKRRIVRDVLRDKLKKLGFFQFQKSVWIYPHECDEEMNYVCEFLGAQSYTLMFTGKIHNDQLLRKYFIREGILEKSDRLKP